MNAYRRKYLKVVFFASLFIVAAVLMMLSHENFSKNLYAQSNSIKGENVLSNPNDKTIAKTDLKAQEDSSVKFKSLESLFQRGFWFALLAAFLTGLVSSLTPCVYPIIPVVVAVIGSKSHGNRIKGLSLSIAFCLGLALIYSILGLLSAKSGSFLGSYLQNESAFIFVALVFFLMGLSLMGLFEIRLPSFFSKIASTKRDSELSPYASTFFYGMVTGIVAVPCIGPFAVGVLTFAAKSQSMLKGMSLLFSFSMGLGMLFIFIGLFSAVLLALPKPGSWMMFLKQIFGIVMAIVAFYYIGFVLSEADLLLIIALGLVFSAFAFRRSAKRYDGRIRRFNKTLAIISGICAALLFFAYPAYDELKYNFGSGVNKTNGIEWLSSESSVLSSADELSKPIMADFYADWCPGCKDLERYTFSDVNVVEKAKSFVPFKVDLSKEDAENERIANKYGIKGLPTIIFLDSRGNEIKKHRVEGYLRANKFLGIMNDVLEHVSTSDVRSSVP